MEIIRIDPRGKLFLSPDIDDWTQIAKQRISAVIDLDGGLDLGVPCIPDKLLYIYYPIRDGRLPEKKKLHALGNFGAMLIGEGHKVLSHCGLGLNRSALVAGIILVSMGMKGKEAVELIRTKRPGALFNPTFAKYLGSL
jgi:protein-tyrosine phosphatase